METLGSLFSLLDRKVPISWVLLIFIIFMSFKMNSMSKDISQIQVNLGNHIGDTNKKIDRLSDRTDDLYRLLLEDKKSLSKEESLPLKNQSSRN